MSDQRSDLPDSTPSPPGKPMAPSAPASIATDLPPLRSMPHSPWAFWVPLLAQAMLILWVPVQATYTLTTGRTVTLQTVPVDPYDLFRGYYVTLNYEISDFTRLAQLPGWGAIESAQVQQQQHSSVFESGIAFYVVLQAPADKVSPPLPWKPVAIQRDRPLQLPADQIALKGLYRGTAVSYNLEQYYIPEAQRQEINTFIQEAQRQALPDPNAAVPTPAAPFVVDIKVGSRGQGVPQGFWLEDQFFRF